MNSPTGLLFSQIGYDLGEAKRALVRGPRHFLVPETPFFLLQNGDCVWNGLARFWGERWGSCWWILDFSELEIAGRFKLQVGAFEGEIAIGARLLWNETASLVSIDQAERRQKVAWKVGGEPLGWFDAGMLWQEANSHSCYLFGLCDLWEKRRSEFSPEEQRRFQIQLQNGGDYLGHLQDLAREKGFGEGALLHQAFFTQGYGADFVNPSDASKSAAAWARLSAVLPLECEEKRADYRRRARLALSWLEEKPRWNDVPFLGFPHGLPDAFRLPDTPPTPDLSAILWAKIELDDPACFELAEQLLRRQISHSEAQDGVWGHFRLFEGHETTEKMWTHGTGSEGYGWNNGQTWGHNLFPLFRLLEKHPQHPSAPRWRAALEAYLRGYFLPGCAANPFGIVPNGHVAGQGFLHFAGLWHGATTIYGVGAALALELSQLFEEPKLREIATANLGWVAGLNAGITRENVREAVLWSAQIPENTAVAASLICGIGARWAGCWLQIRGAIANGFSNGAQFVWDKAPLAVNDAPDALTDEDWITHAGGFLAGLARY